WGGISRRRAGLWSTTHHRTTAFHSLPESRDYGRTCWRQPRPNHEAGDWRSVAGLLRRGKLPPVAPPTQTVPVTLCITGVGTTFSLRLRLHHIALPTATPPPLCLRVPSGDDATLPPMHLNTYAQRFL